MSKKNSVEFVKSVLRIEDLPTTNMPEIVFSGKSNVGKSSLINSLLNNKKIARVSVTPGRTQAINYFLINNSFYFVDLPGYGYAKAPGSLKNKWRKLLDTFLTKNPNIKLIIQLLDFRHNPTADDLMMLDWLKETSKPYIIAFTKCDKIGKTSHLPQQKKLVEYIDIPRDKTLLYSSTKNIGIRELWNIIYSSV